MIEGATEANGEAMATGDAAQVWDEDALTLSASRTTEVILVDVSLGEP